MQEKLEKPGSPGNMFPGSPGGTFYVSLGMAGLVDGLQEALLLFLEACQCPLPCLLWGCWTCPGLLSRASRTPLSTQFSLYPWDRHWPPGQQNAVASFQAPDMILGSRGGGISKPNAYLLILNKCHWSVSKVVIDRLTFPLNNDHSFFQRGIGDRAPRIECLKSLGCGVRGLVPGLSVSHL